MKSLYPHPSKGVVNYYGWGGRVVEMFHDGKKIHGHREQYEIFSWLTFKHMINFHFPTPPPLHCHAIVLTFIFEVK